MPYSWHSAIAAMRSDSSLSACGHCASTISGRQFMSSARPMSAHPNITIYTSLPFICDASDFSLLLLRPELPKAEGYEDAAGEGLQQTLRQAV